MPLLKETAIKPDTEIQNLIDSVVEDAKVQWAPLLYEGSYPENGFGISELRVKHVPGYGGSYWGSSHFWSESITASNTFEAWINGTMTDMAYVLVEGVFNREAVPKVYEIAPKARGNDLPTINIEQMYTLDIARIWFEKPFAVGPNNDLQIQNKGDNTGIERIGLLGHCIAKRAYLIVR